MKSIFHAADSRGKAQFSWLNSHHTFSFGHYYDPERMHFGVLRVLNDDVVAPGMGFQRHPHENMEIVSIPLSGDLKHEDSNGNKTIIKEGDIQVMSAGSGIYHSEFNNNADREVKFLQIWVLPNKRQVEPRYDQRSMREMLKNNEFSQILSPNSEDQGVWIHQNAWFSMGTFDPGKTTTYSLNNQSNGVYLFVLEGAVEVHGQNLGQRDGFGLWETDKIDLKSMADSKVLLMELPMEL